MWFRSELDLPEWSSMVQPVIETPVHPQISGGVGERVNVGLLR